jgi:L-fucose isomerase
LSYSVCLVSTSSGQRLWPSDEISQAERFLSQAARELEELGIKVISHPRIVRTPEDGVVVARELRNSEAEVLICYIGGWSYSSAIVALATEIHLPIMLWTNSRPETAGLVGAGIAKGALDEVGIDHDFVYGEFGEEETRRRLTLLVKGLSLKSKVSRSKFGLFGNRTFGMNTTAIDINQWKRQFNIEVECIDQIELLERARSADTSIVSDVRKWMGETFGQIQGRKDVLDRSISLYVAMLGIIQEYGLDFVAVRCLPELSQYYATFCVANALLNDSIDYRGEKAPFVCACEADGNGALTMQMLKLLTSAPVNFGDVRYVDREKGLLVICNCGSQAPGLADSRKDVHWLPQVSFQGEGGGVCTQYVCKAGSVTLARASRISGEYAMLVETGKCIDTPRERLHETTWEWPHAFVELTSDYRHFLNHVRSNHIHMVYGDVSSELKVACRAMDIKILALDQLPIRGGYLER